MLKEFIKKYWKKILIGVILLVVTFGAYGIYKLIKGGESY